MQKLIIVLLIFIALLMGNPTSDDYTEWVKKQVIGDTQGFAKVIGDVLAPSIS